MNTIEMLDQLANYQAELDVLGFRKQDLIDRVLTPEIKTQIEDIEAEFSSKAQAANEKISLLETEIKARVLGDGATVKSKFLQAVWSKGRVSWDTKALDGYSAAHPEIARFRKEGEPSVSIRKL